MAYVSKELKAKLAPKIREVLKKYKVKGTIAVRNHSTLVVTVRQGEIDFVAESASDAHREQLVEYGNVDINPYWFQNHYEGRAKEFLTELIDAMNEGNYDHSDSQRDYFCVGWYTNVSIGAWDKPYALVK